MNVLRTLGPILSGGLLLGLLAGPALAHGGRNPKPVPPPKVEPPPAYGGPQDAVPEALPPTTPGPNSPRPTTPSSPRPTTPAPGRPGVPAPNQPRTGPRGVQVGPDFSAWHYWWEFNKHKYLRLREAVHGRVARTGSDEFYMGASRRQVTQQTFKPSEADIRNRVLPALLEVLRGEDQRDITTSAMLALGKIGLDPPRFESLALLRARLHSSDQVMRETAALAMGISRRRAAIADLAALATDSPAGRKLCGRSRVHRRTRSFAAYGLGLIASAQEDRDAKREVLVALSTVLEDGKAAEDPKVAAINGLRLLRPDRRSRSYKDWKLVADCVDVLWRYYDRKASAMDQVVQAHVPPAIGEILGRSPELNGKYKAAFADELRRGSRKRADIAQSSAIALGLLCEARETQYSEILQQYFRSGKDQQTRYFCLIALARIGGDQNRSFLLGVLAKGSKALEKPWAALSLGVLVREAAEVKGANGSRRNRAIDETIGLALKHQLDNTKNDQTRAAIAVALGLVGFKDAANDLVELLRRQKHQDELAGYLCTGLALMDSQRARETIQNVAKGSLRRPELLLRSASALARLGDRSIAEELAENLQVKRPRLMTLAVTASALSFVGDRRSLGTLIRLQAEPSLTRLARGYALAALGGVADRAPTPWHAEISVNVNYRAVVATLMDGMSGVLDIL